MADQWPREQAGRMAVLLREQLNEMMAAAHELGDLLSMSEKGREYLSVLNRGLCQQLRMARHLELEYRLSSEDEVRLHPGPVELVELCRDLAEQVESVTRVLGVGVSFHTPLGELLVSADKERLEDMLLCLVSNSVKAIKRDGNLELTLEKQGDRVVFKLSDDGGGLGPAALAEFFGQTDENEPAPGGGLGRGLPLAQKIAKLHGGGILADSYENQGTLLVVSIPFLPPEAGNGLHSRPLLPQEEGWNKTLVELSDCLPALSFLPEELDG